MTVILETLKAPKLDSALKADIRSKANSFIGITAIASGAASVTVSTTAVKSDSLFHISMQSLTDASSGIGRHIEVRTIVEGGYFILGTNDGEAFARDVNVHWDIINKR